MSKIRFNPLVKHISNSHEPAHNPKIVKELAQPERGKNNEC